jgi:hypothetical protein
MQIRESLGDSVIFPKFLSLTIIYNMQEEIWKDIGISKYQISNLGNVRGYKGDKVLKPGVVSAGYCQVRLCKEGIYRNAYVHRLVAEHFLEKPEEGRCLVDHIDRNKTNNCASNLRWATHSENGNNRCNTRECTPEVLKMREYSRMYRLKNLDKYKQYHIKFKESGNKKKIMEQGRAASKQQLLVKHT